MIIYMCNLVLVMLCTYECTVCVYVQHIVILCTWNFLHLIKFTNILLYIPSKYQIT